MGTWPMGKWSGRSNAMEKVILISRWRWENPRLIMDLPLTNFLSKKMLWLPIHHLQILSVKPAELTSRISDSPSRNLNFLICKVRVARRRPLRCLHILRFQVDGQDRLITGGPWGDTEPQAEKGAASGGQDFLQQEPEARRNLREGGVRQVSAEQSNQVTCSLNRKLPRSVLF